MCKIFILLALSAFINNSFAQKLNPNNKALNSRSDTIDILNYQINLDMTDMGNQQISGNCVITFNPKLNSVVNVIDLDLQSLTVDSVIFNSNNLLFTHNDTLLRIPLLTTLNTTDTADITVYYHGSPKKDPSGFGGFYFSSGYAFNLGVAFQDNPHNYGRVWFPCFDNFVEHSTYEFNIISGNGNKSHCNGLLANETVIVGDTISRQWIMTEEIPTYLACIAVAEYETVHQNFIGVNKTVPVELVGVAADTTNMKNSFINLNAAFDAYEESYGPYEWSKIGFSLVPFSSGAMEHATNIAYPRIAANGNLTYETLMAHEFSHHWWGDLVTCETAEDMWINEGMAVYSEHLFLEKIYDYQTSLTEIKDNHKSVVQYAHIDELEFRAISGIPHDYTYGDHVYKKGASVAHNMRAYLGDSLFFVGLQSILNNYQFKNINSAQFRDELTNSTGINMTNFFTDWVFAPGFSHFDIDSVHTTPNGPNFDADVFVQQKLRGASNFHTNTPLEITFYDNNWNSFKDTVVVSGQYSTVTSSNIPFNPTVYVLNEDNRLNQARTDDKYIIKAPTSITNTPLSMVSILDVNNVVDSAMLIIQHHWVAPDSIKNNPNNYRISTSRYWSFDGIVPNNFSASVRLNFDGRSNNGFLDQDLVPVNGDSLILLYRKNPTADWEEYAYYTKTTISQTLAFGWVTIDSLLLGEYTFANSATAIGINEINANKEKSFNIYPNPTQNHFWIEPIDQKKDLNNTFDIYDLTGKLIYSSILTKRTKINTSDWSSGNYIISISSQKGKREQHKLVIK
jgi:aminopeptidase N